MKRLYTTPTVAIVTAVIEQGIAASGDPGGKTPFSPEDAPIINADDIFYEYQ